MTTGHAHGELWPVEHETVRASWSLTTDRSTRPFMTGSVLEVAGLRLQVRGEIPIVIHYPDAEAACRLMMAGSSDARAIQRVGEERVHHVTLEKLEEFRVEVGLRCHQSSD